MTDTIPLHYAQSLLRLAPMKEEELRAELAELRLPLVLLHSNASSDARISTDDYGRLFIHLVRRLQPELVVGSEAADSAVAFSAYRMMFQAMIHAVNLEQAMQRAAVYFQRLGETGDTFSIEIDGELARCEFAFDTEVGRNLDDMENFSMEQLTWLPGTTGRLLSMSMWHRVCCWFVGCFIELESVELIQPGKPGKDYAEVFGVPVVFGAGRDAWTFHRRYLEFPIVQNEVSLAHMLKTYPGDLLKIDPRDSSLAGKVRALIGNDFERGLPGLQDVADRLHLTTPTLHRRLREEGTSFQQLKDQCRRDAAIAYLDRGDYTTGELAELMGFSDSSTFHRAFKKWTGKTPREYRGTRR